MPINLDHIVMMIDELNNLVRRSQEQSKVLLGHQQATQTLLSEIVAKSVGFSQTLQRLENLSTALRVECSKHVTEEQSSICSTSMPNGETKDSASSTDGKSDLRYVQVSTPSDQEAAQAVRSLMTPSKETSGSKSRRQRMRVELSSVASKLALSPRQRKLIEKSMREKERRAVRRSTGTTTR